jgi:hypothetical protein
VNAILFKVGVLGERRASGFAAAHEDEDVDEAVWSIRFRDELAKAESHRSLFGEASPTMKWNWTRAASTSRGDRAGPDPQTGATPGVAKIASRGA